MDAVVNDLAQVTEDVNRDRTDCGSDGDVTGEIEVANRRVVPF